MNLLVTAGPTRAMKDRLNRFFTFFFNTWWFPPLLFGGLLFFVIIAYEIGVVKVINYESFEFPRMHLHWWNTYLFLKIISMGIDCLFWAGFAVIFIRQLVKRRWLNAVGVIGILAGFLLLYWISMLVFVIYMSNHCLL